MTTQLGLFGFEDKEIKVRKQDTTELQNKMRREIYKLRQEKSVMLSAKNPNPFHWHKCTSRIKEIEAIFRQNNWDLDNFGPLFAGL